MESKNLSSLSRSLDLTYFSNRLIIGITIAIFLASILLQLIIGSAFYDSLIWSTRAALSLFFAWAITRELDPDLEITSILVSSMFALSLLYSNNASVIALLWIVTILRFLSRSTGLESTWPDSAFIFLIGVLLTFQYSWIYGLVMASCFILDVFLDKSNSRNTTFIVLSLMLLTIAGFWKGITFGLPILDPFVLGALAASLLFLISIPLTYLPVSKGDHDGITLRKSRLQAARVIAIFIGILGITQGSEIIISLLPLWISLLGVAIISFVLMIEKKSQKRG